MTPQRNTGIFLKSDDLVKKVFAELSKVRLEGSWHSLQREARRARIFRHFLETGKIDPIRKELADVSTYLPGVSQRSRDANMVELYQMFQEVSKTPEGFPVNPAVGVPLVAFLTHVKDARLKQAKEIGDPVVSDYISNTNRTMKLDPEYMITEQRFMIGLPLDLDYAMALFKLPKPAGGPPYSFEDWTGRERMISMVDKNGLTLELFSGDPTRFMALLGCLAMSPNSLPLLHEADIDIKSPKDP